jgi:hypothetical protein
MISIWPSSSFFVRIADQALAVARRFFYGIDIAGGGLSACLK